MTYWTKYITGIKEELTFGFDSKFAYGARKNQVNIINSNIFQMLFKCVTYLHGKICSINFDLRSLIQDFCVNRQRYL